MHRLPLTPFFAGRPTEIARQPHIISALELRNLAIRRVLHIKIRPSMRSRVAVEKSAAGDRSIAHVQLQSLLLSTVSRLLAMAFGGQ